jgi:hypothetical protein
MATKTNELEQPASCLNHSAPDEPLFVLCARDESAPDVVRAWAVMYRCKCGGWDKMTERQRAKYGEAVALSHIMSAWRAENVENGKTGTNSPDVKPGVAGAKLG